PSANPSGRLSPTTAAQVAAALPGVPLLDGGPSLSGVESTILAVDGETVTQLRAGALPRDDIELALGRPIAVAREGGPVTAPGMLHTLDARATEIAVAPIPHHGLGEAINDRLKRAAAPR